MELFGQIVRTVVNTVLVPVAVAKDVVSVAIGEGVQHTPEQIEKLKDEASPR